MIIAWALVAEELGWRGYLQVELGRVVSRRWVPLLVGVIWGAWHFHFFLSGSMEVPIVPFFLGAIFESYGYYAVTEQSDGNIVPASLWHFTGNLFFNLYRFDPSWHEGNLQACWIVTAMYAVNLIYFHYSKRTSS